MIAHGVFSTSLVDKINELVNKFLASAIAPLSNKPSVVAVLTTVKNYKNQPVGSFGELTVKAHRLAGRVQRGVAEQGLTAAIAGLVPDIVAEMENLQRLTVSAGKPKEEQKKEAGFIQQRKRRALNDLFKSLQGLGLSYRYNHMIHYF